MFWMLGMCETSALFMKKNDILRNFAP